MAEIYLVDEAPPGPQGCLRCSTHRGPFIQMDVASQRLYLCVTCVNSVVKVAGGYTRAEYETLRAELEAAQARIAVLEEQLAAFEGEHVSENDDDVPVDELEATN